MLTINNKDLTPLNVIRPDQKVGAGYIHLEVAEGYLTASSSNMQESLRLRLAIESEDRWRATLPPVLLEVLALSGEKVQLEHQEPRVELKSGSFSASLVGVSSDDYDFSYQPVEGHSVEVSADELKKALETVLFAADGAHINPAYGSVLLADYAVATNGYQAAFYKLSAELPGITLPIQSAKNLIKLLGEGKVTVTSNSSKVQFENGGVTYQTSLFHLPFPDWKRILPKELRTDLIFDKGKTLEGLRALRGLEAKGVKISVDSGQAIFEAEGQNGKGQISVPVEGQSEKEWVISQKYLYAVLSAVEEKAEVQISEQTLSLREGLYQGVVALMKKE
jgi:DNA polymerase III sliding clamp (beta) subunit (PCNA family)